MIYRPVSAFDDAWVDRVAELGSGVSAALAGYQHVVDRTIRSSVDHCALPVVTDRLAEYFAANPASLFSLAVAASAGVDPADAVPVAAASAIWWCAAQMFDAAMDADPVAGDGLDRKHLQSDIACGMVALGPILTHCLLTDGSVDLSVRAMWLSDMTDGSIEAAAGQLEDVGLSGMRYHPSAVLARYQRKTGAAFARDVRMVLRLASGSTGAASDTIPAEQWIELGRTFGLLRQLHNDWWDFTHYQRDIANGTVTLLAACGWSAREAAARPELEVLMLRAPRDAAARGRLVDAFRSDATLDLYRFYVRQEHRRGCRLLDVVAPPRTIRQALRIDLDIAAQAALLGLGRQ